MLNAFPDFFLYNINFFRYNALELQNQVSTIEIELQITNKNLNNLRSKEDKTIYGTIVQLVLPMCTVHGKLELTNTSLYFYADGFSEAGLDSKTNARAASNNIDRDGK